MYRWRVMVRFWIEWFRVGLYLFRNPTLENHLRERRAFEERHGNRRSSQ